MKGALPILLLALVLQVSKLGLGGAQFGIYHSSVSKQKGTEIIRRAYDAGINYFDTAPWYGFNSGQSEMLFAEGLRGIDRNSYFMATKVGRYENDILRMFDFSAEKTKTSIHKSLERLKLEHIDLVQVHDFEYAKDLDEILEETLPALEKMRLKGLFHYIGLASYNLPKMKYLLEKSPVRIDAIQNHSCLTLIDQELRDYLSFFKDRHLGTVNSSPLAHGLLTSKGLPKFLEHAPQELVDASRRAVKMCAEKGFKIERLAYGYSARESLRLGVDVLLTGTASLDNLKSNIKIVDEGLTPEESEFCERLQREVFADLKVRNWGNDDVIAFWKKLDHAMARRAVP